MTAGLCTVVLLTLTGSATSNRQHVNKTERELVVIPEDVDINELVHELDADGVYIGSLADQYPSMEEQLIAVTQKAEEQGIGDMKIAFIDQTPAHTADLRDIAQELLNNTGADLVLVRNPMSGAVVSTDVSRATLEAAQYHFLADPDYVRASNSFVDYVSSSSIPWALIGIVVLIGLVLVAAGTWFFARRSRPA